MAQTHTNKLHEFVSYSYAHVLLLSGTTDSVMSFVNGATSDPESFIDKVSQNNGDRSIPIANGNVYAIVNGFVDTDYAINSLSIETLIPPAVRPAENVNPLSVFSLSGSMTIVEPHSARLLTVIKTILDKLNRRSMVDVQWVLKTFFVGVREDGSTEWISDIKPLRFVITDLQASFDASGGEYNISFVSTSNGAAKIEGLSQHIPKSINATTTKNAIEIYESDLNKSASVAQQRFEESNPGIPARRVTYKIDLDDELDRPLDLKNVGANSAGNNVAAINLPTQYTPEQSISDILYYATDLQQSVVFGGAIPSIHSEVIHKEDSVEVKYTVTKTKLDDESEPLLQFDYIYTGRNVDVIGFDMKLTSAFSYISHVSPDTAHKTRQQADADGEQNADPTREPKVPPGTDENVTFQSGIASTSNPNSVTMSNESKPDKGVKKDVKNQQLENKYLDTLNDYAMLDSLGINLQILGDPVFLGQVLRVVQDTTSNPDINTNGNLIQWPKTPGYCKVNVFTPRTGNIIDDPASTVLEPFWYQGRYRIHQITSNFRDGAFTQELLLIADPIGGATASSSLTDGNGP